MSLPFRLREDLDTAAVRQFTDAMLDKLELARQRGRDGWWDDTAVSDEELSVMLREHVEKGDPVDVANFCMFLFHRGGRIL